jgi:hypothetical protein
MNEIGENPSLCYLTLIGGLFYSTALLHGEENLPPHQCGARGSTVQKT